MIEFNVKGTGRLKAVGVDDQHSHTPLRGKRIEAFSGEYLAIVEWIGNNDRCNMRIAPGSSGYIESGVN